MLVTIQTLPKSAVFLAGINGDADAGCDSKRCCEHGWRDTVLKLLDLAVHGRFNWRQSTFSLLFYSH
jgi:hypothetical protein